MATVVFDLDGTLADTAADLIAAANHVFRDAGHGDQLRVGQDDRTAYRGGRAMLRLGYERLGVDDVHDQVEAGYPLLLAAYADRLDHHTVLYPGAAQALRRLADKGYRLAVCTNKPEAMAEALLRSLGVRQAFGSVIGADTLPVRKPDPVPLFEAIERAGGHRGKAVLIGDTETDRETARAAGLPCILVTFGPEGKDVALLEPEGVFDHFDSLDDALHPHLPPPG